MSQLTSSDGTTIAFERTGDGPAVVLIHVGPFTQALNAGLAGLLAGKFTVYTYDRRGRGGSGGAVTDGPDREFADLSAVIDHAGGHAHVYGSSGAGTPGTSAIEAMSSCVSGSAAGVSNSTRSRANRPGASRKTIPSSMPES